MKVSSIFNFDSNGEAIGAHTVDRNMCYRPNSNSE